MAPTLVGLTILGFSARPTLAPDASPGAPANVRKGYEKAANELLCYCGCSRLTIKECTCGVAFGLRDQFEAKLAAGETAESLIAAYVSEHGEQARNVPPKRGLNLLAWFGPGVAILLAAVATVLTLLYWTSKGRRTAHEPASIETSPEDEAARQRVEREIEEYEL